MNNMFVVNPLVGMQYYGHCTIGNRLQLESNINRRAVLEERFKTDFRTKPDYS
jgi:hypothetical protein